MDLRRQIPMLRIKRIENIKRTTNIDCHIKILKLILWLFFGIFYGLMSDNCQDFKEVFVPRIYCSSSGLKLKSELAHSKIGVNNSVTEWSAYIDCHLIFLFLKICQFRLFFSVLEALLPCASFWKFLDNFFDHFFQQG